MKLHFEQLESSFDTIGHELINEINLFDEKNGKEIDWALTDKFEELTKLLQAKLQSMYPNDKFQNF